MEVLAKNDEAGTYSLELGKMKIPDGDLLVVFTDGKKDFGCIVPKNEKDLGFYFEQAKKLIAE